MEKKLTSELESLKEEFDFIHKKIGDLEWELATINLGKRVVIRTEREDLEERIDNYRANICLLIEKIKQTVAEVNQSK